MNAPEKRSLAKGVASKKSRPALPRYLTRPLNLPSLDVVKRAAMVCCALTLCMALLVSPVDAAKKKKGAGALDKILEPLNKIIAELVVKAESNSLFSAKENGEVLDVKFQLIDLLKDNATNPSMAKPMYQTALIMVKREQFNDAYDMFNYVLTNFADSPYAFQSRVELGKMKKLLGEVAFAELAGEAAAPATDPAKPAKGK